MYFYRAEKVDILLTFDWPRPHCNWQNVVTNVNIFNEGNLAYVEEIIAQVFLRIDHDADIPRDEQLVIDMQQKEQRVGYYFASLQGRCLFYTQEGSLTTSEGPPNIRSYTHIGTVSFSGDGCIESHCRAW
jgi:hypothetical protein